MADNKNMTQEEIDNGEEMTVTLTLDDGRVRCSDDFPGRR